MPAVSAPPGPFTAGVQVGVPTGTVLTATSGLPAPDAIENYLLVHPVTGEVAVREVRVWRRRKWTTIITPTPAAGVTYRFDECEFDIASDTWCLEVGDTNGVADQMQPLAILTRCTLHGNSTTGKALLASYVWLVGCDLRDCEDGWAGAAYSVAIGCNIVADTDGLADPHADGIQVSGAGHTTLYRSWVSAGNVAEAMNAAVRIGTEFSAVSAVHLFHCGLSSGGYTLQMRGDSGAGDISGVQVVG